MGCLIQLIIVGACTVVGLVVGGGALGAVIGAVIGFFIIAKLNSL